MHWIEPCVKENCPVVFSDFTDVIGYDDWQLRKIENFFDRGIINGYEDNTLRLNHSVTRAEFVAMLARKLGYEDLSVKALDFVDIPSGHWANPVIAKLVSIGAINGVSETKFAPDEQITCEQAAKIIAVAYGWTKGVDIEKAGGYPRAYYQMADFKGILDDVKAGQSEPINRMDLIEMLYSATEHFDAESFLKFAYRDHETRSNWYWQ